MIKKFKNSINLENKKILFLLVAVYSFLVAWGYTIYLEPIWGYFGLDAIEVTWSIKIFSMLFCLLPFLFLPKAITRPSMFAVWILYLFTYIPMVVGAYYDKKIEVEDKWIICTAYATGMLLLCFFYRLKLLKFTSKNLPSKYFWTIFYGITFAMLAYIVFLYKENLTFGNIFSSEDIYAIRFSGQDIQDSSAIAGHLIMWLSNALFPFILSVGFVEKNRKKIIIGIVGMVIMYMTMANKQFLFSIIFLYVIYRLFKSTNLKKLTTLLIYIISITATLLILTEYVDIPFLNETVFIVSGIFLLRTLYTSTLMSVYYNVFFENHPYIYFSHVTGINKIIKYPYDRQIGIEVGTYFIDIDDKFNANANFFLTDGLSSVGLWGIPLVGFILGIVFYFYDSASSKNNLILGILLIANSSVALMNVSLFTTLISGGLLLFIFLMNNKNLFSKTI